MVARNPTNKKNEPRSARAERVEEIRKEISECLANARQACKDNKGTYEYDRLHDFLRAECYQAKKLRHLADAALLKEENPQQAETHFRKAFGKSGLDWIENIKLLAAHKILTDLYGRSYREAAHIILAIRPAVAKLANEKQIVNLRKHFEHSRPKGFVEWQRPKGFGRCGRTAAAPSVVLGRCSLEMYLGRSPAGLSPDRLRLLPYRLDQAPGLANATKYLLTSKAAFRTVSLCNPAK